MLRPVPPSASVDVRKGATEEFPAAEGHEEALEAMADFVADRLAPEERARIRDHLKTCPACQKANPVRREDMLRRSLRLAFPMPTERDKREMRDRVEALTGVRISRG